DRLVLRRGLPRAGRHRGFVARALRRGGGDSRAEPTLRGCEDRHPRSPRAGGGGGEPSAQHGMAVPCGFRCGGDCGGVGGRARGRGGGGQARGGGVTSAAWHYAVSAADWASVSDACLQGVVHACNNRVAALGGIVQLQDHKLASAEEGFASLREEVVRFRALMELLRALMARKGEKREPARMVEALRAAAALLA